MNAPKNFREFMAQQKAKKKQISKSPIEKLISDLKLNPDLFIQNYKKDLEEILSKENPQLKNLQEENLITVFIDQSEINPDLKKHYNDFMALAKKGFLTTNKNKETFLLEISKRNNLKLFLETILNLDNLNLLSEELLSAKNVNSENCFNYIIQSIKTTNEKQLLMKNKECFDLIKKVLNLIFEKYNTFNVLTQSQIFNIFNIDSKIKLSERSLQTLSKEDILNDFEIIFKNEKNFESCKVILYEKQLPYNLLISLLEKNYDLIHVFIEKYTKNKFCSYPELFFDFLFHVLNFEIYKNVMDLLPKIIPIIIKEKDFEKKLKSNQSENIYHLLFSNNKISLKEKNDLFAYLNTNLLKDNDDIIEALLIQDNKDGYPPFIVYLFNINKINDEEEKFLKEKILEKSIINNINNKNAKYKNALLNLLEKEKIFMILFDFLEKNKLINLFDYNSKTGSCLLIEFTSKKIKSEAIISKIYSFVINNFDSEIFYTNDVRHLLKFIMNYFRVNEFKQIIYLIKVKFLPEIKMEEDLFEDKNRIKKIEYKEIAKYIFEFNSKFYYLNKAVTAFVVEIYFNRDYDLEEIKEPLISILDLIGVNNYNEVILNICLASKNFKPDVINIFISKYYSKFKLTENNATLKYFSLCNFQTSFYDNDKMKNNNYIYFYLQFINGIKDPETKIYYKCVIFSLLNYYKYEEYIPLFFTEKEKESINNFRSLFIKPKLLNDDIKLTLIGSLLDFNIYNNFNTQYISKLAPSNVYSILNIVNNNKNEKIEFNIGFNENLEKNEEYKLACDLLSKHLMPKFYFCFLNSIMKKSPVYKFLNFCMKEISKSIEEESDFVEIAHYEIDEFVKYHDIIKEKKLNIGMENNEVKNENNIFGINVIYLLFKNIFVNKTFKEKFTMDDLSLDILTLKNKYFTEFNIILDEKDGEEYHYIDFNDDNYNIEKYIIQFCNFNVFYDKIAPLAYKKMIFAFKNINDKIKGIKFIENLFTNKTSILREIHDKIDFEKSLKILVKENDWDKVKEKVDELKNIKTMTFGNFIDCLSKFYQILIEYYKE